MAVSQLLCILWFAALLGASGHKRVQGNYVCFQGASNVHFTLTDKVIARGQPWGQPSIEQTLWQGGKTEEWPCIEVKAGRHNSKQVANSFMRGLSSSNVMGEKYNDVPEKLHFYVEGTLSFAFPGKMGCPVGIECPVAVECPSIRLAQGSRWPHDPWWIGSLSCSGNHEPIEVWTNPITCECRNGAQVQFNYGASGGGFKKSEQMDFRVELVRSADYYATVAMQQGAVSEFGNGSGSAALAAAAVPRLALEGNSTQLRVSLNNQASSLSAATQRSSISEVGSARATSVPAGETTSNNNMTEAIFYP